MMSVLVPWYSDPSWMPTCVLRKVPQEIPSSTTPSLVVTDAGHGYLKMPSNPQGPAALVSELVGTMLACWFELRTFHHALIDVAPADIDPESTDESTVPAFITQAGRGETWKGTSKELRSLLNPEAVSRLVVFDTWVGNVDRHSVRMRHGEPSGHRNDGNVFLSNQADAKKLEIIAYDHTHCHFALISASPEVEILSKIEDTAVYGCFPEFRPLIQRDLVRSAAKRLQNFTEDDMLQVAEVIPEAWLSNPLARSRIVEFGTRRAQFVAESIERKLFPQGELNL